MHQERWKLQSSIVAKWHIFMANGVYCFIERRKINKTQNYNRREQQPSVVCGRVHRY